VAPLLRRSHLLSQRRALDDLDPRAPGIGDVGDGVTAATRARRLVEPDAVGLELAHEGRVIPHVEADVVEDAPSRHRLLRIRHGEADLHARQIHDRLVVPRSGLAAERFRVPRLRLRNFSRGQRQVDVLVLDRHRLRLVFEDLDAHAVRRHDKGLVQPAVAAREHVHALGLPLCGPLLDVVHDEAHMIDDGADRAAVAFLHPEIEIDVDPWERHQRIAAGHVHFRAHGEEQFLVGLHIPRNEMPMPHGHAGIVVRGGLRGGRSCGQS